METNATVIITGLVFSCAIGKRKWRITNQREVLFETSETMAKHCKM
jgi:hypothetical protein